MDSTRSNTSRTGFPMRVAVTGANGFLGRRLVGRLTADGHRVVAVGQGVVAAGCEIVDGRFDACDWSKIGAIDILFHFAAINDTSIRDEDEIRRVNVDAALECFERAIGAGCRAIVSASSMHVYGRAPAPMTVAGSIPAPVSLYGRSKLQLERETTALCQERGVGCVGLRFANVYGPGESHKGRMASQVLQIARQMRAGNPEIYAPGTQVRDFIHVDDAVDATVKAAAVAGGGACRILNCGSGVGTSFNDLVAMLNAALGLDRTPRYVPEPPGYLRAVVLDVAETVSLLSWHPRPLRTGLEDYLASGECR